MSSFSSDISSRQLLMTVQERGVFEITSKLKNKSLVDEVLSLNDKPQNRDDFTMLRELLLI